MTKSMNETQIRKEISMEKDSWTKVVDKVKAIEGLVSVHGRDPKHLKRNRRSFYKTFNGVSTFSNSGIIVNSEFGKFVYKNLFLIY